MGKLFCPQAARLVMVRWCLSEPRKKLLKAVFVAQLLEIWRTQLEVVSSNPAR